MDKIYKILVDILDVKAGFPLANFFRQSDLFENKDWILLFFTSKKSCEPMSIQQKVASYEKKSQVGPNASPFTGRFPLVC